MVDHRKLFVACFAVVIGIITWGDISTCHEMPFPPRIVATGLVFGLLDIASSFLGDVAPLIGVGIVIAAIINKSFRQPNCNERLAAATTQPPSYQYLTGAPAVTPGQTLA